MRTGILAVIAFGALSLSSVVDAADCPDAHSQMLDQILRGVIVKYGDKPFSVDEGRIYKLVIQKATRPVDEGMLNFACRFLAHQLHKTYDLYDPTQFGRILAGCPEGIAEEVLARPQDYNEANTNRADSHDYLPIVRVDPVYPEQALDDGISGNVTIGFSVTKKGKVRRPRVVDSSDPVFEKAALVAVRKFLYKPRVENGKPVTTNDVKVEVTFTHPDSEEYYECPDFGPPQLLSDEELEILSLTPEIG